MVVIGIQQQDMADPIDERAATETIFSHPNFSDGSHRFAIPVVLLVMTLHATLLMLAFFRSQSTPVTLSSPVISGVLIQVPEQPGSHTQAQAKQSTKQAVPTPTMPPKPIEIAQADNRLPPARERAPSEPVTPITRVSETPVDIPHVPSEQIKNEAEQTDDSSTAIVPPRSDAKHLNNPSPVYPRTALRLGQQGKVILNLLVLADGTVDVVTVKQSSGYQRLDNAAVRAVRRWRYSPASQNGQAIDYWYQQPIIFSLQK